jgi:hypothetical protein
MMGYWRNKMESALHVLIAAALLCAPLAASPQKDGGSALKPWRIRQFYVDPLFEVRRSVAIDEKALVSVSSKKGIGSRESTVCFKASEPEMAEIAETLRQLSLTGAPKPVPRKTQKQQMDMPVSSFTVTYNGTTYDLAAEYEAEPKERLAKLVSELQAGGEKRIADLQSGKSVAADSVPCPVLRGSDE